jgi:hypothetical protein
MNAKGRIAAIARATTKKMGRENNSELSAARHSLGASRMSKAGAA